MTGYLRHAWVLLSVGLLVFALVTFDRGANKDVDILLDWAMMALSFPISVLFSMVAGAILFGLNAAFAIELESGRPAMFVSWLGFFVSGYFQWFYLVPMLWKRVRDWHRPAVAPKSAHGE